MDLNGYHVEIIGGRHFSGAYQLDFDHYGTWGPNLNPGDASYVELTHNSKYRIRMENNHDVRCNAEVIIDGNSVGTWRLQPYQTITIERPANIDKQFTFYRVDSAGGRQAGLRPGASRNGLVKIKFTPEKTSYLDKGIIYSRGGFSDMRKQSVNFSASLCNQSASFSNDYEEGGTGLQGRSFQRFDQAGRMELDHGKTTTINLRLVARRNYDNRFDRGTRSWYEDVTPLKQGSSNPEPPPLGMGFLRPSRPLSSFW